jgi:hypothetical protein
MKKPNVKPFNIHILNNEESLTLTILPENNYFKIIYLGGIVDALKKLESDWELMPQEEIEAGSLPFYDYKKSIDNTPKLELNLTKINQITCEIEDFF